MFQLKCQSEKIQNNVLQKVIADANYGNAFARDYDNNVWITASEF